MLLSTVDTLTSMSPLSALCCLILKDALLKIIIYLKSAKWMDGKISLMESKYKSGNRPFTVQDLGNRRLVIQYTNNILYNKNKIEQNAYQVWGCHQSCSSCVASTTALSMIHSTTRHKKVKLKILLKSLKGWQRGK